MNQRAIQTVAMAVTTAQMKWKAENGGDKASCVDCPDEVIAAAVITAYEAHLKAEGFVVVPVIPTPAMMRAAQSTNNNHTPDKWTAMLSAATGENDASDR